MNQQPPTGLDSAGLPERAVSYQCEGSVTLDSMIVPVTLTFEYLPEEPFAVRMVLDPVLAPPVVWVFARDLLVDGLERPAGLGDVQMWPVPVRPHRLAAGKGTVNIRISSPHGSTTVSTPASALRHFLGRTTEMVALGTEVQVLRLAPFIAALQAPDGHGPDGGAM